MYLCIVALTSLHQHAGGELLGRKAWREGVHNAHLLGTVIHKGTKKFSTTS